MNIITPATEDLEQFLSELLIICFVIFTFGLGAFLIRPDRTKDRSLVCRICEQGDAFDD